MVATGWEWENGLTSKRQHEGIFWGDGSVRYVDCEME